MKSLNYELSEYLDKYRLANYGRMPSDAEIKDFKHEYKKRYLKNYYCQNKQKNKNNRKILSLILTQEEDKILKEFCVQHKKKKRPFSKEMIFSTIQNRQTMSEGVEEKLQEIIIQMRKIGNNINQQTKIAHKIGAAYYEHAFSKTIEQLLEMDKALEDMMKALC